MGRFCLGAMSCQNPWSCLPKPFGVTNPYAQQSRRQSITAMQPGQSHGPASWPSPTAADQTKAV